MLNLNVQYLLICHMSSSTQDLVMCASTEMYDMLYVNKLLVTINTFIPVCFIN